MVLQIKYQSLLSLMVLPGVIFLGGCFDAEKHTESGLKVSADTSLQGHHNKIIRHDAQRTLLDVAGLGAVQESTSNLLKAYFHPVLLNMENQTITDEPGAIARYRESVKNHTLTRQALDADKNLARLSSRDQWVLVYIVGGHDSVNHGSGTNGSKQNGVQEASLTPGKQLIVPIEGKGYLSMLKGYLSLDLKTLSIQRIRFYEQGETPALGGKIMTNAQWLAQFQGKRILEDGQANFRVVMPHQNHQDHFTIDGLSGATNTSHSVENLINYWMGPDGYYFALTLLQQRYL